MKRGITIGLLLVALVCVSLSQADWKMRVHEGETVTEFTVADIDSLTFYADSIIDGMLLLPAGTFWMGSTEDELGSHYDEWPRHEVTLTRPFWIKVTEVTNQQYAQLAQWAVDHDYATATPSSLRDALDGSTEELLDLDGEFCDISYVDSLFEVNEDRGDHPVSEVSWYGAARYCDWLSLQAGATLAERAYAHGGDWSCNGGDPYGAAWYRLPTEAEWEYACRAGSETAFANGPITYPYNCVPVDSVLDVIACFCGNNPEGVTPIPVGQKIPNNWGLFDMHGNVWEWCNDWHKSSYYYTSPATDPIGPPSGEQREMRGGFWHNDAAGCRSANRYKDHPADSGDVPDYMYGVRPVRSAD